MPDSAARLAALRSGQIDTLGQWGDSQLNSIDPTPHGIINNEDPLLGTPFDEWPEEVKQYYRYDPERAKQLLVEAGYPDGLKTELKYFERYDANYAEPVVGYWAEIGVDVEMSIHSSPESQAILQGHASCC